MVAERQQTDRGRHGDHAQFQLLLDLRAVRVDEIEIHGRNGSRLKADAKTGLEDVAKAGEVLAADRDRVEVLDVEREKVQVVDEDVVGRSRILGARREAADREVE